MDQLGLFGEAKGVLPASQPPEVIALGERLPAGLRMGTSSWSFPGWGGLVWGATADATRLSREGLSAYAAHPLLRCVGVDRSFYAPMSAADHAAYAAAVPEGFRFVVKVPEQALWVRFPKLPKYGALAGQANPRCLDAGWLRDFAVGPYLEGLGARGGALVLQVPPQGAAAFGGARRFAERLYLALRDQPREAQLAVELRDPELLSADYAAALQHGRAVHAYAIHPRMPGLAAQREVVGAQAGPLVVRWMLGHGLSYEEALAAYRPFTRMVAPDLVQRASLVERIAEALGDQREVLVTVNNKAEGCAPESVRALAEAVLAGGLGA